MPVFDEAWEQLREGDEFAPSLGKVPILWDGDCVVWDSLAIIEFLADRVGRDNFWPADDAARGMARSMAAEMHSCFANLRRDLPMNVRRNHGARELSQTVVERDQPHPAIMGAGPRPVRRHRRNICSATGAPPTSCIAPVVTRFVTYSVPVPPFAATYMEAVLDASCRRRMDREGPGRTLGDRGIRDRAGLDRQYGVPSLWRYWSVGPSASMSMSG